VSIKERALKSLVWTGLEQFGNQILNFVITLILARLLVPEEFGLIAIISIFINLGATLINSGLTQSLIRSEKLDNEDYSSVFYFNVIVSLFIYIAIFLLSPLIADFFSLNELVPLIRIYAITFIFDSFGIIHIAKFTKELNFKIQMLISTPSLLIGGAVGVIMAYYGFGVWSLVYSKIIQSLAHNSQLWIRSEWRPAFTFHYHKLKNHLRFGFNLTVSSVLDTIFSNVLTIIIGKYFDSSKVGFYNQAERIQMLPVKLLSSLVSRIAFPLFSEIQFDDVKLKNAYKNIMQMVVFVIAPILIFAAVLGEPLFRFLLTDKWLPAVSYFQILCISGILYPIHSYNLQVLNVKGRSDIYLNLEIIKKIILTLIIFISFQFGIFGLLYGYAGFSVIAFFINSYYSGKLIGYSSFDQVKDLFPILFAAVISGFTIFVIDSFTFVYFFNDFSRLFIGLFSGLGVFLFLSLLLKLDPFDEIIIILKKII
jgi:teichuronic acid exporter